MGFPDSVLATLVGRHIRDLRIADDTNSHRYSAVVLGCGGGRHVKMLLDMGIQNVMGMDSDPDMVSQCLKHSVPVRCTDITKEPVPQCHTVIAYGIAMVIPNLNLILARTCADQIIVNLRTPADPLVNLIQAPQVYPECVEGEILCPGHTLHELYYYLYADMHIPGYRQVETINTAIDATYLGEPRPDRSTRYRYIVFRRDV